MNVSGVFITDNRARYALLNGKKSVMFCGDDYSYVITVSQNSMRVNKRGEFTYELTFDTDKPSPVIISSPMGQLSDFYLTTDRLEITQSDNGFSVSAEYRLSIDPDQKNLTLTCEYDD